MRRPFDSASRTCIFSIFLCFGVIAVPRAEAASGQSGLSGGKGLSGGGDNAPSGFRALAPEERGDLYMARKMYREAVRAYSTVPETSAVRWNKIGIAHHQMLDYKDAKNCYRTAIKLDPNYGEALNNLGTIYYAEKGYRSAVKQYKKALRMMPDSASVFSNLGTAYFARADYRRASEAYEEAVKLDPDVFEHHNGYGVILEEHSVVERAKYHYYLAKMYAKEGMDQRALQCMRKALEEGFGERRKFMEDPEFAGLRNNLEFQEIIKSDPRVL